MTNEEKAVELFPNIPTLECLCCDIREKLVEMAEWKDEQFEKQKKEFLDKACEWLTENIDISKRQSHIVMDFRKYMEDEQ